MAIIGEELQGFVINQINARQRLHGSGAGNDIANTRTDQQLNLLISNTSWIKLASGVSISGSKLTEVGIPSSYEGMGLAKQYILNAGFSKLEDGRLQQREGFLPQQSNSSYTYGTYGYSPMPGIISADIKTLNRGSLKKATVRIKINNKEQFDIIDLLYLRLGFTVLLEWGNSIYTPDGVTRETVRGTLVEDPYRFFNSAFGSKNSYLNILPVINFYKTKYAGNYDALLGKVSNFSWSFNADGSYDAEITIISLGDVIESLKLNVSTDKHLNNFIIASTGGAITPVSPSSSSPSTGSSATGSSQLPNSSTYITTPSYTYKNNITTIKGGYFVPKGTSNMADALHSFQKRNSDGFGGQMSTTINNTLLSMYNNKINPQVTDLKIVVDSTKFTVEWEATIAPSKNGKAYIGFSTVGSAGAGADIRAKSQIEAMKKWVANAEDYTQVLDFSNIVGLLKEPNGIYIRQYFYQYTKPKYFPPLLANNKIDLTIDKSDLSTYDAE